MQLTDHFSELELNVEAAEPRIKANAKYLCEAILEPIRAQFGEPMHISSGYRPPSLNQAVNGVSDSEHLYEDDHAAADFEIPGVALTHVFNWIRSVSHLPFRQVILEYDGGIPACIHISARSGGNDKHEALIGETHNGGAYTVVACA